MNYFFYMFLFILWTMFWSFASVVIYRIRSQEWWIMWGRSHCKTCSRNLSARELIPIISWMLQWWKCAWCKKNISSLYPILEFTTWFLFLSVWYFLMSPELIFAGNSLEIFKLLFFLWLMFFTVVYVFYDILYLEIPESILVGANILVVIALIAQWYWYNFIPYLPVWNLDFMTLWICLIILCSLYYIMLAGLRELYDCLILIWIIILIIGYMNIAELHYNSSALLTGTIAALSIFISFFLQIVVSRGRWMWAWDLRIAILMWLLVGASFAFPAWMITYLAWSIIGVWIIIVSKIRYGQQSEINHQIPFWPFLACGYLAILFFHPQISNVIELYFL